MADVWLDTARAAVERSIRQLATEFLDHPFTHRREHSLHVDLYQSLINQPELRGFYPIGSTREQTRLVHKEWPTTVPASLRNSTKRLQSYDLAVLSPVDLAALPSVSAFLSGKPPARIAIELSLDYNLMHMELDTMKFRRNIEEVMAPNWAPVAYLIHFTRVPTGRSAGVDALLRSTAAAKSISPTFAEYNQKTGRFRVWPLGGDDFDPADAGH
jgi:hypothetical protein